MVLAVLVVGASVSVGEVPYLFNYQGILTDSGGLPLDGQYDLTFKIYPDSLVATPALWSEQHLDVYIDDGLFNVMLGGVTALHDSLFEGAERWLGIAVDTDSEMSPRMRITSVPWAFRAAVADTVLNVPGLAAHDHDDRYYTESELNTSGSINDPSNPVDWTKLKSVPAGFADGVDDVGGGGGGWADDGTAVRLETETDDVGIGTTTPQAKLDVRGTLNVGEDSTGHNVNFYGMEGGSRFFWDEERMALRAGRDSTGIGWHPDSIGYYSLAAGFGPRASGAHSVALGSGATATGEYSVSIGSNTIGGNTSATAIGRWATATGYNATAIGRNVKAKGQFSLAAGAFADAEVSKSMVLGTGISSSDRLVNDIENSLMVGFDDTTSTLFVGGPDSRVGVRTDSPEAELHVAGHAKVDSTLEMTGLKMPTGASSGYVLTSDGEGTGTWQPGGGGGPDGDWTIAGDDMYSTLSGHVGIGTSSPEFKLSLDGDGGILAEGTIGSGATLTTSGAGTRMIWYPREGAFRAGTALGSEWDEANIGQYSAAFGWGTKARWQGSFAAGMFTVADNAGDVAMGTNTTASGPYALAMGERTAALGRTSFALGKYVRAGPADNTIALGSGAASNDSLVNNIANSMMVGFNTNTPTLFVGGTNGRVGIKTSSPDTDLDVEGGFRVGRGGIGGSTGNILAGFGTWMYFNQAEAAFRAGAVHDADIWNLPQHVGTFSVAMGHNPEAAESVTVAIGENVAATAPRAMVLGRGLDQDHPLTNDIRSSLMVGFDDTTSTLFVGGPDDRVGIGTDTPLQKLHVAGHVKIDSTVMVDGFKMTRDSEEGYVLMTDDQGVGTWQPMSAGSGGGDGDWLISGDDMYSNVAGNVGIGTSSPSQKLDVDGTVKVSNAVHVDGNVGIGTASPFQPLDVYGDVLVGGGSTHKDGGSEFVTIRGQSDDWIIAVDNQASASLTDFSIVKTAGDGTFHIENDGDIGIGTTSPAAKLDVAGHVSTDSTYQIGGNTVLAVPTTRTTLVGIGAGESQTYLDNTFVGYGAGRNVTTGGNNTFVGSRAGEYSTSGSVTQNVFIGTWAGMECRDGLSNVAVGFAAGYKIGGQGNVCVGAGAGRGGLAGNTGNTGVFIGMNAGNNHNTGDKNVFIGDKAGYGNETGERNVFLGPLAGYSELGSDKLYIANDSTTALIYGDFSTEDVEINGYLEVRDSLVVEGPIGIGKLSPDAKLHIDAPSNTDDILRLDRAGFNKLVVQWDGDVGINTTSPLAKVHAVNSNDNYGYLGGISYGVYGRYGVSGSYGYLGGSSYGVYGANASGSDYGYVGATAKGVYGYSYGGRGVHGQVGSASGWAGYFSGDVNVTGSVSKGGGSFVIDHPLDPENKLLRHNFVESPENLLIYRGKVELDGRGEAVVEMPDYFAALTKEDEASIHLTCVGRPFMTGAEWDPGFESLTVYGDANREVYWEVLADRDDPVIHQLAKPVEEMKGPGNKICDRGQLLYPTAYGYPETMGKDYHESE
jgi:hypothetical protein